MKKIKIIYVPHEDVEQIKRKENFVSLYQYESQVIGVREFGRIGNTIYEVAL